MKFNLKDNLKFIYKNLPMFVFLIMITISLLNSNTSDENQVSIEENRILASIPKIFNEEGELVFNSNEFEDYFDDNIGFREEYVEITGVVTHNILNKTPSKIAKEGDDNWIFFTPDNNLEIAYGEYPLTIEELEFIASNQEKIYNALKEEGIEYALILVPSKVSVYPEELNSNLSITKTPSDILKEYLEENTNVPVINLKDALISEKENYQVYYKSDTHWTRAATYIAADEIAESFYNLGYLYNDNANATPTFLEREFVGDVQYSFSNRDFLDSEIVSEAYVENPKAISYENLEMQSIVDNRNTVFNYKSYINDSINSRNLLLYSDSMFANNDRADFLAEYFNKLDIFRVDYSTRGIFIEDILEINPDIVAVSLTERMITRLATGLNDYNFNKATFDNLPIEENTYITMYLDSMGYYLGAENEINLNDLKNNQLELNGWAIDSEYNTNLSEVYVQIGNESYTMNYGGESEYIANHFENEDFNNVKFYINIDTEYLIENNIKEIYIGAISKDNSYQYDKIKINLTW